MADNLLSPDVAMAWDRNLGGHCVMTMVKTVKYLFGPASSYQMRMTCCYADPFVIAVNPTPTKKRSLLLWRIG